MENRSFEGFQFKRYVSLPEGKPKLNMIMFGSTDRAILFRNLGFGLIMTDSSLKLQIFPVLSDENMFAVHIYIHKISHQIYNILCHNDMFFIYHINHIQLNIHEPMAGRFSRNRL